MEQPHSKDLERRPVSFPDWKNALRMAGLPEAKQSEYEREIITFLHCCKKLHCPATIALAKTYLAEHVGQAENASREALRWFFKGAKTAPTSSLDKGNARAKVSGRLSTPPLTANDLGSSPWEQALIQAMRSRHFLWRTEETYRRRAA